MNVSFSEKKLLHLIERKRNEMIETALKTGLLSMQTLRKSTELDDLLNLQQQIDFTLIKGELQTQME